VRHRRLEPENGNKNVQNQNDYDPNCRQTAGSLKILKFLKRCHIRELKSVLQLLLILRNRVEITRVQRRSIIWAKTD